MLKARAQAIPWFAFILCLDSSNNIKKVSILVKSTAIKNNNTELKYAKKKNPHKGWVNWRNYKMSLIKTDKLDKVLVYAHEKDAFENLTFAKKTSKSALETQKVL